MKLIDQINELDEVLISDIKLTGNLTTDLANIETFDQGKVGFPLKDYKKPSGVYMVYNSLASTPLDLLINTLNGKIKRLKRARKNLEFDRIVDKGMYALPRSFYTTDLAIPEDKIHRFVEHCAKDDIFHKIVTKENTLELISYYYNQAPLFLQRLSSLQE